ncbi:MAG TPA: hypothetical protein VNK41_03520 [Vicinamibacterales bacterium]|nr:hypothetical protein [Vicinamibacterales bacterium]
MGEIVRIGSLEIDQDLDHQRREWRLERLGWVLGALIIAAAALGLFGSGPLSSSEAAAGPDFHVAYERFLRHGSSNRITLSVDTGARRVLPMEVPSAYLARMRLEQVFPEPRRVASLPGWTRFEFDVEPDTRMVIVMDFAPARRGPSDGAFRRPDGPTVRFRQFVYP